jgi:hypothetical protein
MVVWRFAPKPVRARVQASVFPTGPKGHCDQTLQSDLPGSHLYSLPAVTKPLMHKREGVGNTIALGY